jgi:hypothetical protein
MAVDDRIELRIAAGDKAALSQRAEDEGVTLSTLLRRGIRLVLGRPVRLEGEDALEVVALRRRVNAIAARLDELGEGGAEVMTLRRDIAQVHTAQALLGRG